MKWFEKFAQPISSPGENDLFDEAWDWLDEEKEEQTHRMIAHGTPREPWLEEDRDMLEEAMDTGDENVAKEIIRKYKAIAQQREQGRQQSAEEFRRARGSSA